MNYPVPKQLLKRIIIFIKNLSFRKKILVSCIILFLIFYTQILPQKLFNDPISTVIQDQNGELLSALIAQDMQWRFPVNNHIPEKFIQCIKTFEDKRFNYHWGIDILSTVRALWQNIKARKTISGGSTITMQVIRLSRKGKPRTYFEKLWEMLLATRLEFSYSKKNILGLYASNAPFGGNIVGLDAASWRYFGRPAEQLSWAETAMLAVLPNSPALIHPGKNRTKLLSKRNQLLKKLFDRKIIDHETYELSIEEEIPDKPKDFPDFAHHLLIRINKEKHPESIIRTTINKKLQEKTEYLVKNHQRLIISNDIHNIAVLIIEVESGNVLAYVGNVYDEDTPTNENNVDVCIAPRSTGSILKPFLYALMLSSGELLPEMLLPDIPTQIAGYVPENFTRRYDGAVPANKALIRSLNIPAVRSLQKYGVEIFHHKLKKLGMSTIKKPPEHYGLSLILGGCEGTLWEISGIYASMARTLNNYSKYNSMYNKKDFHAPVYHVNKVENNNELTLEKESILSAASIYFTMKALLDAERPEEEINWEQFSSAQKISWKTGTSFGYRDAWSIGVTPKYVVGVWVGNADGEGRPGLIGVKMAAPLLFRIFENLQETTKWFEKPFDELVKARICTKSGFLASENCETIDSIWIPETGLRTETCPYHQLVHLDLSGKYQVNSDCEAIDNIQHKSWFVLPPSMEFYFKMRNSSYVTLPPFREDCKNIMLNSSENIMEIVYPQNLAKIFIPIELDGSEGKTVFEVAHRDTDAEIHWHIDNQYIGTTTKFHKISINTEQGDHLLTIVDNKGRKLSRNFKIIGKY